MKKKKFKDTEIGRIPEEWEIRTVDSFCSVKTGPFGSMLHAEDYVAKGTPIVTTEHFKNGALPVVGKDIPQVGTEDLKRMSSYTLTKDDIVFSRVGSVDINALVTVHQKGWLFSGRVLRVRPFMQTDSLYLHYALLKHSVRSDIVSRAVGLTMASINTKILGETGLSLPPLNEQHSIASAITSIDNMISSLGKLIEKKKNIKQGAMQQLLTGKTRLKGFDEPWEEKRLGNILAYEQPTKYLVSTTNYSENGIPVLTAGKTFILGYTNEVSGVFTTYPTIIFDDFTTESKYVDFPFKAKSSAMKMLSLKKEGSNNLRFIYEIMQMIDFPTTDHKRYWIEQYSQLIVQVPKKKEQDAITEILTSMDNEITALEAKRAKYEAIKQGMMQQLLTGKIRLIS